MGPSIPHPHPTAVLLFFYLVLIAAAAYAGGAWVAWLQLGHRPMQVILSFTGGILLGVGMLHLLPHAVLELQGDVDTAATWALGGFFLMFLLERAFHAHAHHAADSTGCDHPDHEHHHGHDHGPAAGPGAAPSPASPSTASPTGRPWPHRSMPTPATAPRSWPASPRSSRSCSTSRSTPGSSPR